MATSDVALERVQALLKVDTGAGSLYTHIARIARALASEKPDQALSQVDALSWKLKKTGFRGVSGPDPPQDVVADAAAEDERRRWCADALQLVGAPSDPLSGERALAAVQDVMEDAAMFEWVGVGFGKQEWFHIAMSLRKLAAETERLEKLRLWGKILGIDADYYVAEGTIELPTLGRGDENVVVLPGMPEFDVEPRGEGANSCTYWVSTGGASPWVRLPAARASHIVAARKIKHLMTGDLGSLVQSMPFFPGKERHLLRGQIARISSTCTLAVAGFYQQAADSDTSKKLELADELPLMDPATLAAASGWVHAAPALLSIGKSDWPNIDNLPDDENLTQEQLKAKTEVQQRKEMEEPKPMLEGIAADLQEVVVLPEDAEADSIVAWNIKSYGDKGTYTFEAGPKSYQVTAVRSLIWPGAVTVAQGNKFANLYVGYGLKCSNLVPPQKDSGLPLPGSMPFSSGNMCPMMPADVMEEPGDQAEEKEPQPDQLDDQSDGGEMAEDAAEG